MTTGKTVRDASGLTAEQAKFTHKSAKVPPLPKTQPTNPWGGMSNNKRIFVNIIGTMAAVLSSATLIPQLVEVVSSRNVAGLSLGTYAIVISVSIMWMGYHLMIGTYHGLVSSSFNLGIGSAIFYFIMTIRYQGAEGIDTR